MKLKFPESILSKLRTSLRANPGATGVILTDAELVAVYEELVSANDSGCVMLSQAKGRSFYIDGRWIKVEVQS